MEQSVNNGVNILKYAISQKISAIQASAKFGKGKNYIYNVRVRIDDRLRNRSIDKKEYDQFMRFYREYENMAENVNFSIKSNGSTNSKKSITLSSMVSANYSNNDYETTDNNNEKEEVYDAYKDKAYDEKKSNSGVRRDLHGKITSYWYNISVKGERDLQGQFNREEMDMIYKLYSMEGAGLTLKDVSREFNNLTFRDFKRILRVFNITKSSVSVAPHIIEEETQDDVANIILKNKENNILRKIEIDKDKFFERSLIDAHKKLSEFKSQEEWIEETVKKYVSVGNSPRISRIKLEKGENKKEKSSKFSKPSFIIFSDVHFGKIFETPIYGRGTNKEILHERIMQIADYAIQDYKQRNPSEIFLVFGGDFIEAVSEEGLRPGHHFEMDLYMENQIFFACDSLKAMINKIVEETQCPISVNLISANHDRIGQTRTDDKSRTAGKIISHIIKREVSTDKVKVNIPANNLVKIVNGNICMFLQHGDTSLSKKSASELMNLYGERGKYSVFLQGHWHKLKTEEGTNFVSITMPSVCSTDSFIMNELGSNCLPGFIIGHESENAYGFDFKKITLY